MIVHEQSIDKLTAVWLIPVVAPIIAAATGGELCTVLDSRSTLAASYALWGIGVPFAGSILVLYIHRLTVYKLPPSEVSVSAFLPIGPLGQGGAGIIQLGIVAEQMNFPYATNLRAIGVFLGLLMWGYAILWSVFAVLTIGYRFPRISFSMAWWGFVFPLGTFALCSGLLGKELELPFFKILGTIVTVCVVLLWFLVAFKTTIEAWKGELFYAPCLGPIVPLPPVSADVASDVVPEPPSDQSSE